MAKASSPVRLEASLMDAAGLTGSIEHRSAVQQVEHWASLGRMIERMVSPSNLTRVASGVSMINVSDIKGKAIDPDALFQALEVDRVAGKLSQKVTNSDSIRYQKSLSREGFLDQIHPDGTTVVGSFKSGIFTKANN